MLPREEHVQSNYMCHFRTIIAVEFKKWHRVFIYGSCREFPGSPNGAAVVCFVEIIVTAAVVFHLFDLMRMFKNTIPFNSPPKLEKAMTGNTISRGMWSSSIVQAPYTAAAPHWMMNTNTKRDMVLAARVGLSLLLPIVPTE